MLKCEEVLQQYKNDLAIFRADFLKFIESATSLDEITSFIERRYPSSPVEKLFTAGAEDKISVRDDENFWQVSRRYNKVLDEFADLTAGIDPQCGRAFVAWVLTHHALWDAVRTFVRAELLGRKRKEFADVA